MNCGSRFHAFPFPALLSQPVSLVASELSASEEEAACFEHASKKAVAACHRCGRFVCALCRMEADGAVWCPTCLVSGLSKYSVPTLENQRTLYDSIALGLAALPLCLFYMAVFTGPVALFLAIRYWKRPSSLIPRTKWRLVVALLLGTLETAALIGGIVLIIWAVRQRMTS